MISGVFFLNNFLFSQISYAELLGIPKRSIENWESGASNPPKYVVRLIAFYIANKEKEG